MLRQTILAAAALFLASSAAQAVEQVMFAAGDGAPVHGDAYRPQATPKAAILLFHQAGSNRGEYATIAPRLTSEGYAVLAIDQRSGGTMWGRDNLTAGEHGTAASYADALPDLEGALTFAQATWPGVPVIVWGSSYSASLVFVLAARHPDTVSAVLSFSPGEYFSNLSVRDSAAKVRSPVFVTSASSGDEVAAAREILAAVSGAHKTQFIAKQAVHGSSALRADRNPDGAEDVWRAVDRFLATVP